MNTSVKRRPTNVSLDPALVAAARELGVNVSRACEAGLASELKRVREERWQAENAAAIEGWNRWIAEHGLPMEKYRRF